MRALNVFRNWTRTGGPVGFYTKFTSDRIPAAEGCYAWFLPLWLYRDDLGELLDVVNHVLRYEPAPESSASAPFNWERVDLKVRRNVKRRSIDAYERTWDSLLADASGRKALEQVLVESSLLMPPLYVGRAGDLQKRYFQHTRGGSFHDRFADCAREAELPLSVSDLLYVCVTTEGSFDDVAEAPEDIETLLEGLLMQTSRPPFSLK